MRHRRPRGSLDWPSALFWFLLQLCFASDKRDMLPQRITRGAQVLEGLRQKKSSREAICYNTKYNVIT
jgi:hypothetical protein